MTNFDATLPVETRVVTACDIVMGAAATRDWQRQHHDHVHAINMQLPGIIMNAPTQSGWLHAYAMRWAGEGARIIKWQLKMRAPICPGEVIHLSGQVTTCQFTEKGQTENLILELKLSTQDEVKTVMNLNLRRNAKL